ncbi:MAG TPA: hypothetical protein DIC42_00635 [Holosporales bacterium]|nr:hypothetical protein [Holosporales bacterium]
MYKIILGLYVVFNIVPVYSASEGADDPATQPKILCRRDTFSSDSCSELMLVRQNAFTTLPGQQFNEASQESLASTVRVAEFSQNFEEEDDDSDSGR